MGQKLILSGLLAAFSLCYTQWGDGHSAFVWEMQVGILSQIPDDPGVIFHPMLLAGLLGQMGLIYGMLVSPHKKWIVRTGIAMLGLVVSVFLAAGILGLSPKITASTLPFWIFVFLYWKTNRRTKP